MFLQNKNYRGAGSEKFERKNNGKQHSQLYVGEVKKQLSDYSFLYDNILFDFDDIRRKIFAGGYYGDASF